MIFFARGVFASPPHIVRGLSCTPPPSVLGNGSPVGEGVGFCPSPPHYLSSESGEGVDEKISPERKVPNSSSEVIRLHPVEYKVVV